MRNRVREADGGVRLRRRVVGDALEGAILGGGEGLWLRRRVVVMAAGEGFGFVFVGHLCCVLSLRGFLTGAREMVL